MAAEDGLLETQTVNDVLGCLRATGGFALILILPGYAVGALLNVAGWRRLASSERLLWSVGLSFAVVPIALALLLRFGGWGGVFGSLGVIWLVAAWQMGKSRRGGSARVASRIDGRWWLVALGWTLFAIAELLDAGVRGHLYLSVTVFDHALRTAFVDAVMRTGAPPANPLFWPGHPAPMRYYYFWYVVTAAAAKLTATTARQALIASVVWAGFGLTAAIGLYGRRFLPERTGAKPGLSRVAIGVALLGVAGLDILPAIAKLLLRVPVDPDMDWWAPDQVTTWLGSLLWVPHHVAALIGCVVGFLLIWLGGQLERERLRNVLLAGVAFASAFGLSMWVALAFALALSGWAVWAWWQGRFARGCVKLLLGAGLIASLVLLPYLEELRTEPSGVVTATGGGADAEASAGRLMRFGVRRMIDAEPMETLPGFARLARAHPRVEEALAGLLLLVPGYFAELGFWVVVLMVMLGARRLSEAERHARALVLVGLLVTSFLRSTIVTNNDFAMRSALVMQFFLLLFGIRWFEGEKRLAGGGLRRLAAAMLWVGVAGTVYQAALLRFYLPVEEKLGNPEMVGLSERAAALESALTEMSKRADKSAVVQFNNDQPSDYFRFVQILFAGRQIASALPVCTVGFGGDARDCRRVEAGTAALFTVAQGGGVKTALSAAEARALCAGLGTTALVATRWDAVWYDRAGWVWNLPKVVDTGDVRVVNCAP